MDWKWHFSHLKSENSRKISRKLIIFNVKCLKITQKIFNFWFSTHFSAFFLSKIAIFIENQWFPLLRKISEICEFSGFLNWKISFFNCFSLYSLLFFLFKPTCAWRGRPLRPPEASSLPLFSILISRSNRSFGLEWLSIFWKNEKN